MHAVSLALGVQAGIRDMITKRICVQEGILEMSVHRYLVAVSEPVGEF